jgi:hypothetical protein
LFYRFLIRVLCLIVLSGIGCRESQDEVVNPALAPVITNLTIVPETVCVGSGAQISFTVSDPNGDQITWSARMNTSVHGNLEQTSGTVASGTSVQIRFKAATGGNHRHRVTTTVTAIDQGGSTAEAKEIQFFVFSTC